MLIGIELLDTIRQDEIIRRENTCKKMWLCDSSKEWCRENLINTILRSNPSGKG